MRLENKAAIVTGAGWGLGRAIALSLAQEGADVVVTDINIETAQKVAEQIKASGHRAMAIKADVTNSKEVDEMVNASLREFGKIDILVNNAGGSAREKCTEFRESNEETWDFVIGRNLKGTFICTRAVINHMIQRKSGKIVNIASIAGVRSEAGQVDYGASKGGVLAFTRSLAQEAGPFGINVNSVSPGIILGTAASENVPREITEQALSKQYLKRSDGRYGEPRDVANAVVFLVSEESSFITGDNILVSGGLGI
ncbi:SDR family NAD(P)-dependent oxidoreductase [Chloroflexota bacterium]